jgi:quinol monooxygenase YgiN
MSGVVLSGRLLCADAEQARAVREHLPEHIALTRAEPGCIVFDVAPTDDPLIWEVSERFESADVFRAHQTRVAASEWGRVTAQIERRYTVEGLRD